MAVAPHGIDMEIESLRLDFQVLYITQTKHQSIRGKTQRKKKKKKENQKQGGREEIGDPARAA